MICNFTIAMLHYPEIMRKAQAELDKVVGRERAPNFEDKNNLPYVQAIVRETLRWRPVAPLGWLRMIAYDKSKLILITIQVYHIRQLRYVYGILEGSLRFDWSLRWHRTNGTAATSSLKVSGMCNGSVATLFTLTTY